MEERFWEACSNGRVEEVKNLLQNSKINTNWQDSELKRTPFYTACKEGHIEIVKLLINDKRIDINKANKNGATPFKVACQNGHIEIVKILLNENRIDVNQANDSGVSPFWTACSKNQIEVVKLLLNNDRVDINKARNGETPFWFACYQGQIGILKHLLACGREIDINKKNKNGKTPLDASKERSSSTQKVDWETEEQYQKAKRNWPKIIELIESFQRNPIETRTKLRKELESTYEIEHNGRLYILKTTAFTLLELESDIRLKFKLQEDTKFDLEFVRNGKYFVLEDMEDLQDGATIRVCVSTQLQNVKIHNISNLKNSNPSVFLTHTWVKDELNRDNHSRVATVNKLLKAHGFKTWFDEDKMEGHIDQRMAEGINDSDVILVFITKTYMEKLNTEGHDNCKKEFTYAIIQNKKMIPIVMESCMRNHKEWIGILGVNLAGDLYVDMSETDSEYNITALIERLKRI